VLPVVLRLRSVAEKWGGLIGEVDAAAAAAAGGHPAALASRIATAGGLARRALAAAGEDAKALMAAAAEDTGSCGAAGGGAAGGGAAGGGALAREAAAAAAGLAAAGESAAARIRSVAAALTGAVAVDASDRNSKLATKSDRVVIATAARGLEEAMKDVLDDVMLDVRDASTMAAGVLSTSAGAGEAEVKDASAKMAAAAAAARAAVEAALAYARVVLADALQSDGELRWRAMPAPECPGRARAGAGPLDTAAAAGAAAAAHHTAMQPPPPPQVQQQQPQSPQQQLRSAPVQPQQETTSARHGVSTSAPLAGVASADLAPGVNTQPPAAAPALALAPAPALAAPAAPPPPPPPQWEERRPPRDLFAALRAHFTTGAGRLKDTFNELDRAGPHNQCTRHHSVSGPGVYVFIISFYISSGEADYRTICDRVIVYSIRP